MGCLFIHKTQGGNIYGLKPMKGFKIYTFASIAVFHDSFQSSLSSDWKYAAPPREVVRFGAVD